GAGTYEEGSQVTLTATPSPGFRFLRWEEVGQEVSKDNPMTFTAERNRSLTAVFESMPTYTISCSVSPVESGTVEGAGSYEEGSQVTLTATPSPGFRFLRWEEGGQEVSTENPCIFTATSDRELVACFVHAWQKAFGGTGEERLYSVQQTSDGDYIMAGYTNSSTKGGYDAYLAKADPSGNIIWERTFGMEGDDRAHSVQQTLDGGYILAGYTNSFGAGGYDAYLVKTDDSGKLDWEKTFGEKKNDYAYSVRQTADKGYILAGYTNSFGSGDNNVYLVKTDDSGKLDWEKTFGGTGEEAAYSVQQTSDEGYILAGYTTSFGAGSYDAYLLKTDSSGNFQWDKVFGLDYYVEINHFVRQTMDGGYIVAGIMDITDMGLNDAYLVKTDSSGNPQGQGIFNFSADDVAATVQQTVDGGYIMAGYTNSFGAGGYDAYLVKTDSYLNSQWHKTFGGAGEEAAYSVQQTTDGGYILAGYTTSSGAAGYDAYLVKTDPLGNI
ncbi:MAG: hypothetical protein HPY75_04680, partial [Actinobacteria bacterium]|nr:hypothetical protein [Actinomycetota bacterium]